MVQWSMRLILISYFFFSDEIKPEKNPMSTVNTARIFFLWNQLKRPKFNPKTLKKLDSVETIIQLNAMSLGLKLSIYEIDPEIIWKYLHNVSLKFPLGLQIHYLRKIGFNFEEIRSLLLTEKPIGFSSKDLPFTHEEYIPLMSEQLSNIRNNSPDMDSIDIMKQLTSHDFDLKPANDWDQVKI